MDQKEFLCFLKGAFFISWGEDSLLVAWNPLKKKSKDYDGLFFYRSNFFLLKNDFIAFKNYEILSKGALKSLILECSSQLSKNFFKNKINKNSFSFKSHWVFPSKKKFLEKTLKIKALLDKGDLIKALPIVHEVSNQRVQAADKIYFLFSLLQNQVKGGFLYGFWNEKEGLMGQTPEVLFDWNGKRNILFSMALAGTALKRSKKSLLKDTKEVSEHNVVLSDLSGKLEKLGTVWKSKTFEWPYGMLKHLRTNFFLKLKDPIKAKKELKRIPLRIIESLHPTPALGLYSEKLTKKELMSLERILNPERQYFGAPFSIFFPKEKRFLSLVAIRNLQWFNEKVHLTAGCGFISKSDPHKEWEELKWKRESVRKLFNLSFS